LCLDRSQVLPAKWFLVFDKEAKSFKIYNVSNSHFFPFVVSLLIDLRE